MARITNNVAIKVQWYNNDKQIIYIEVEGTWDWLDVEVGAEQVQHLAKSANYPLALMALIPNDLSIPPAGFARNSRLVADGHAKAGLHTIVYIIKNMGLKTLWQETISAVANDSSIYFIADSEDAALSIIQERLG